MYSFCINDYYCFFFQHLLQTLSHPLSVEELGGNLAAYSKLCDEYMVRL